MDSRLIGNPPCPDCGSLGESQGLYSGKGKKSGPFADGGRFADRRPNYYVCSNPECPGLKPGAKSTTYYFDGERTYSNLKLYLAKLMEQN